MRVEGKLVKLKAGAPKSPPRRRARRYDEAVLKVLKAIWHVFDCMCCQTADDRVAYHDSSARTLGELERTEEVREKLQRISGPPSIGC